VDYRMRRSRGWSFLTGHWGVYLCERHCGDHSGLDMMNTQCSDQGWKLPRPGRFDWQGVPCAKAVSPDSNYHESDLETVSQSGVLEGQEVEGAS